MLLMLMLMMTTTIEWDQLPCLIRFLARCRWEPLLAPTLKEESECASVPRVASDTSRKRRAGGAGGE
jgi:hypothetical protein